jgi:hypothetical protein
MKPLSLERGHSIKAGLAKPLVIRTFSIGAIRNRSGEMVVCSSVPEDRDSLRGQRSDSYGTQRSGCG